ncbi:MAG: site-specific integrase [Ferruginibacter sp.]
MLDINLHFFCRGGHQYKNGLNPVVLRITYRKERKDILTGLSCSKENWLPDLQQVRSDQKTISPVNKEIFNILHKVKERFHELKYSGNDFTMDELVERVRGKEAPPQSLIEYIDIKLLELKDRVDFDLAQSTYYKYQRISRYLNDFLQVRRGVKNISVGNIDGEFLKQLFLFIRKEKKNSHNSTVALLNCLKTILRIPVQNGTIKRNPFEEFPLTQKPVHRDFLENDEIKRLQQVDNLTPAQEIKRDLFLFACFTGLAYADIKSLRGADIVTDPDGTISIRNPRQKTGVMSIIPLISVAQQILKKYAGSNDCREFKWYVPSNQKLNSGLKDIAIKAKIDKPLFMHLGRHTFATTVTLTNGIPIETVSKMLGHSTIKHTQIYAKIVASKVKLDMSKIADVFS